MKVRYAPAAQRDLSKIHAYLLSESKSSEVADRFILRLLDACERLATFPSGYPVYSHRQQTRMMPFENYVVFFKVAENEVRVRHVRHAARRPYLK